MQNRHLTAHFTAVPSTPGHLQPPGFSILINLSGTSGMAWWLGPTVKSGMAGHSMLTFHFHIDNLLHYFTLDSVSLCSWLWYIRLLYFTAISYDKDFATSMTVKVTRQQWNIHQQVFGVTNSVQQRPSLGANSCSFSQEILHLWCVPNSY
jgi:hypothetical protein